MKLFIASYFCCFINMQIKKFASVFEIVSNTGFFHGRVFN